MNDIVPGIHRVRKANAQGGVTEYWYAFRGGPRVLRASAASDALLDKAVKKLSAGAIAAAKANERPTDDITVFGLITKYLASPAFAALSERTRKDRRKFLEIARQDRGQDELKAYRAAGAKALMLRWRDRYIAGRKRGVGLKSGDELLAHFSAALAWGVEQELLSANPLKELPRQYTCNRADVIWEPADLARLYPHCSTELNHAVRLAVLTGARAGDLIELTWGAVLEHAMTWQTNKSRGRRTVVVPITPELRALLDEIPRRDSVTILNSSRGKPWTDAGLGTAFRIAKMDAGIKGLRFHDLRGTAATNFSRRGLEPTEIATILGWAKEQVDGIITRYVTAETLGLALVEKLRRNAKGTIPVNRQRNRVSGEGAKVAKRS